MARLFADPFFTALDSNGDPISGAKLQFDLTGTSTPQAIYTDNALSVAHTNPVIADSAGRFAAIYLSDQIDYKVTLKDAADAVIDTIDPVHGRELGLDTANVFTKTQTWTKGSDVASASALTLGDGNYFDVTGTTAITSIGTKGVGTWIKLHFDGALLLTHHATDLVLPGGADILTQAGDEAELYEYALGDWRLATYQRNRPPVIADTITKTADHTVVLSDNGTTILADATSAALTITLPVAATAGDGFEVSVKKIDSTVNTVTVDGDSAETIDGVASITFRTINDRVTIVCDGTGWHIKSASLFDLSAPIATTSGTEHDFTGILAGAKRITFAFDGVSLSGTDQIFIQLGDSVGIENTGYIATSLRLAGGAGGAGDEVINANSTAAFFINNGSASNITTGLVTLVLSDAPNNTWIASGVVQLGTSDMVVSAGSKSLSDVLTQVRITRSGTNTFDAGVVNVLVE